MLVEADHAAGVVTTFTVDPLNNGEQSRVTIATDMKASPGITGLMEKLINPPVTRRIFQQELRQLADYIHSKSATL